MSFQTRRTFLQFAAAAGLLPAAARAATGTTPGTSPATAPDKGSEIPAMWNLAEIYPSPAAWSAERDAVLAALPSLAARRGKLGDPATLRDVLMQQSSLDRRMDRLDAYASLKADENLGDASAQERRSLALALHSKLDEATAWIDPELIALGPDRIDQALATDKALAPFRFHLQDLRRLAPHVLDAKGEALLAAAQQPFSGTEQIRDQLVNADLPWPSITLDGKPVRLDNQNFVAHRTAENRTDRKRVFDSFFGAYKNFESTLGAALATELRDNIFVADARHYPGALEAALAPNAIPRQVYESMIAETNRGLPVLHRYLELRRRILKLPDLAYYDLYVPATTGSPRFDLAAARRNMLAAVAPLGPDYVAKLAHASAAGWMDALPRKGKSSGAYMNPAAYDVHPFVLVNFTDDYEGMTTVTHEFGHAMHTVLDDAAQPYETSQYSTFIAEIPSTANEQFLADYMIRHATDPKQKLFFLDQLCELLRGTYFRQAMLAEFEFTIYDRSQKGEAMSGAKFSQIYLEILRRYYGPGVRVDDLYGIEWAYIPHFYFDFYVYQYATSIAASAFFVDSILRDGAPARDRYLDALRAGGSDHPTVILQRAGLDMSSPAPYRALIDKFSRTLDAMEPLIR
ncbi:M3 family oligoendopeptidase [Rhizosaccharibacter radicis]|uniref:Oligoendopeptidase F family protein n=1 Tax=Rhizosaccharibacter radicis TaxID=2782605 RepID=A0ABT1W290_9PROT|nr:oligoendopeptidase F family protein [Acetobacteraceae bacterium KSS12]